MMEDSPGFDIVAGVRDLPPVLTVEEVADLLRVDRKTAYAAIADGSLPGIRRIGRCIRVSRDAFLDWLKEGTSSQGVRRRAQ